MLCSWRSLPCSLVWEEQCGWAYAFPCRGTRTPAALTGGTAPLWGACSCSVLPREDPAESPAWGTRDATPLPDPARGLLGSATSCYPAPSSPSFLGSWSLLHRAGPSTCPALLCGFFLPGPGSWALSMPCMAAGRLLPSSQHWRTPASGSRAACSVSALGLQGLLSELLRHKHKPPARRGGFAPPGSHQQHPLGYLQARASGALLSDTSGEPLGRIACSSSFTILPTFPAAVKPCHLLLLALGKPFPSPSPSPWNLPIAPAPPWCV